MLVRWKDVCNRSTFYCIFVCTLSILYVSCFTGWKKFWAFSNWASLIVRSFLLSFQKQEGEGGYLETVSDTCDVQNTSHATERNIGQKVLRYDLEIPTIGTYMSLFSSLFSPLFFALLLATSVDSWPRWSGPLSSSRLRGGQRYHHLRLLFLLLQAAVILSVLSSITTWHEEKGRREKPVLASYHITRPYKRDLGYVKSRETV